jgi:hypothetical protein
MRTAGRRVLAFRAPPPTPALRKTELQLTDGGRVCLIFRVEGLGRLLARTVRGMFGTTSRERPLAISGWARKGALPTYLQERRTRYMCFYIRFKGES